MARIDSLLSILRQQNANELQLGTDREPKLLAHGAARRLSLPATPEATLRELLGEILTPQRDETLRTKGRVHASYASGSFGMFEVKMAVRADGGFDVSFVRSDSDGVAARAASAPSVPPPAGRAGAPGTAAPSPLSRVADSSTSSSAAREEGPAAFAHLVASAASLRASDVHLVDGAPPIARVDGRLRRVSQAPVHLASTLPIDDASIERISAGHSFEAACDLPGVGRARLHVFRTAEGLAAAIRLLPGHAPSLASLHMPVSLDDLVMLPNGLVIVCGATGAGKSTTLAALAQEALRRRSIVLSTLEDPIEYALDAGDSCVVRRRQIGRDVPDFVAGLRDALREDPDVLLVGEMRDPGTITLALTAAETGHLVLSSLHSGSAASAVERIVDAYPPERASQIRVQLADCLKAIVVQRLLPRAQRAGRVPAVEVLRVTHAIGSIIRDGKTAQLASTMQSGRREGMITLERCLADRVLAGEVDEEVARAMANDVGSFSMYLSR